MRILCLIGCHRFKGNYNYIYEYCRCGASRERNHLRNVHIVRVGCIIAGLTLTLYKL